MRFRIVMTAIACLGLVGAAGAHHSAAGIDRSKTVTLVGTVKEFGWRNPHSYMEIDVPNESGQTVTWKVEMTSPAFLIRAGWKSSTVKVFPLRDGDPGGLFQSVTLGSGEVLTERAATRTQ
jgi:uncharacterized protein DUF6152